MWTSRQSTQRTSMQTSPSAFAARPGRRSMQTARVPNSPIGPHPPAVGKEDCTERTISGMPRKANRPNTMIETSAETACHTHKLAPSTLAELTRRTWAMAASMAKARNAPARAIHASRKKERRSEVTPLMKAPSDRVCEIRSPAPDKSALPRTAWESAAADLCDLSR